MTVRIYLAGPSSELERVKKYARQLDDSGMVEITYRWWEDVEANMKAGTPDSAMSREEQSRHASSDLDGVARAQIVWCLWPSERRSEGVPVELGYAIAVGSRIVVSGTRCHECIFTAEAEFRDAYDDVALSEVLSIADTIDFHHP